MTPLLDPARPVRWGIASTGRIAGHFAEALTRVADADVVAVASRAQQSADQFGDRHGISRRYSTYEALADDADIDVVYVGTPHSRHYADTLLYLEADKHVLCEKPFALNQSQAATMCETAGARGRFLMEAMWSRFLPAYVELRELVTQHHIGDVRMVTASFGFRAPLDPSHRLFALELGGGALLDVGIYPVQLATMLLGEPDHVTAVGEIGTTGVDEQIVVAMTFSGGQIAVAEAAIRTNLPCTARISGTDGAIELPAFHHCPSFLDVSAGGPPARVDLPFDGNGLHYQAEEVHRCLRAGLLESPVMPLSDTRAIARTLDRARAQVELVYPGE